MFFATLLALAAAAPVAVASSPANDYNPSLDWSERRLVFARSEADFRNARIMIAERRGKGWTTPAPIAFSDARYSDSDPWLTPDGNTLYFVSNRPTPSRPIKQDLDIWPSPEHLGDAVNSAGPELGPELHNDVLYFASVRKGGQGALDIYAAPLDQAGAAGPAALASGPFNSAESDSDFTLSADGHTAAFWRGSGGQGRVHISKLTKAGWSTPEPLDADVNRGPFNFTPAFARDGRTLWFASTAERPGQEPGMADIYQARLR